MTRYRYDMPTQDVRRPFALLVRTRRTEASLSQQQLAEKVGVNQVTISAWERAENIPGDADKITRLADALNVPLAVMDHLLTDGIVPDDIKALMVTRPLETPAYRKASVTMRTDDDVVRRTFEAANYVKQVRAQMHYTNASTAVPDRLVTDAFKFVLDEILELRMWQQHCRETLYDLQQAGKIADDVNLSAILFDA